jgi:hypothetical protein
MKLKYKSLNNTVYTKRGAIYQISEVNSTKTPVLYSVVDLMKEKLPNFFYSEQLTKTRKPDKDFFLVEKVIGKKKMKGISYLHVKFLYYPEKFNLWVPESNITTSYEETLPNE